MINAKDEFLNAVGINTVLCADILYVHDNVDVTIQLKCSYSFEDWNTFIEKLNFEYDDTCYGQRVWGTIWFTDGSWAEREENGYSGTIDGYLYGYPNIPESLL